MPTLFITRGLPGAGKSTWARHYQSVFPGTLIFERDALRREFPREEDADVFNYENFITARQQERVRAGLKAKADVIVSDTHLRDKYVRGWLKVAHEEGARVQTIEFRELELEKALEQNAYRPESDRVPEEVIRGMHKRFIKGRDLSVPVTYEPEEEKTQFEPYEQGSGDFTVIFDIDGTLATMGERSPYDDERVGEDEPTFAVTEALWGFKRLAYRIILVSGRKSEHRHLTEKWLAIHGIQYDELHMRPMGDNRRDDVVKYELFNKHIRPDNPYIVAVFDDRHRVLRMWKALGLTTFHVNGPDWGDF